MLQRLISGVAITNLMSSNKSPSVFLFLTFHPFYFFSFALFTLLMIFLRTFELNSLTISWRYIVFKHFFSHSFWTRHFSFRYDFFYATSNRVFTSWLLKILLKFMLAHKITYETFRLRPYPEMWDEKLTKNSFSLNLRKEEQKLEVNEIL